MLNIIDLKKKAGDLLSYLKLNKQPDINSVKIKNSPEVVIRGSREYIQDKVIPEIIDAIGKGSINVKNQR